MAAGKDRDRHGADRQAAGTYALVGELIEAHASLARAITEYLVRAIGPPEGVEGTLREAVENSRVRDKLLVQYGSSLGLEIKYSYVGRLQKARNALAHNIVSVDGDAVRTRKGGQESRFGREDLQRYISEARDISSRLESFGGRGA